MKLEILTDKGYQNMLGVYDIFFTPENLQNAVKDYTSISDFYSVYREIIELSHILYGDKKEIGVSKRFTLADEVLQTKLNDLDLPKLMPNRYPNATPKRNRDLAKISDMVSSIFYSKENEIDNLLYGMFKTRLPKRTILILAEKNSKKGESAVGGHALNDDPAVIGCYLSSVKHKTLEKLSRDVMCVALHELLHIILPHKSELPDAHKSNLYEEALISYFAPEGILTERLGLSGHIPIDEIYKKNIAARPYLKRYAKMLLPVMKRYTSTNDRSIWEAL